MCFLLVRKSSTLEDLELL